MYLANYLGAVSDLSRFQSFISSGAWLYDVPEEWIKAVILTESSGNPQAYRYEAKINDASYGLMQLLYSTAKGLGYTGTAAGLYDPKTNILFGSMLLGQLRKKYGDDFARVYSAYNSGRPDLYLTSTQVGTNVSRALSNLAKFATETAAQVYTVGIDTAEAAASPAGGLVLLGLAAVFFSSRRQRR